MVLVPHLLFLVPSLQPEATFEAVERMPLLWLIHLLNKSKPGVPNVRP